MRLLLPFGTDDQSPKRTRTPAGRGVDHAWHIPPQWIPEWLDARGRQRKVLVAADQEALRPTRGVIRIKSELPRPLEQCGQHGPGFNAGQRGPHAVVDALSECEMTAWGPAARSTRTSRPPTCTAP